MIGDMGLIKESNEEMLCLEANINDNEMSMVMNKGNIDEVKV